MDKFESRIEALIYLLVRDHVRLGDFQKIINDVMLESDGKFFFEKEDDLIKLIRSKIGRLKNG